MKCGAVASTIKKTNRPYLGERANGSIVTQTGGKKKNNPCVAALLTRIYVLVTYHIVHLKEMQAF